MKGVNVYAVKVAWEPNPQLSIRASWSLYPTLEDAIRAARRIMADNPRRRVVVAEGTK